MNYTKPYRIISVKFFCLYLWEHQGWFRLFGYGLSWKNTDKCELMFSERNKLGKNRVQIGKYLFKLLKK